MREVASDSAENLAFNLNFPKASICIIFGFYCGNGAFRCNNCVLPPPPHPSILLDVQDSTQVFLTSTSYLEGYLTFSYYLIFGRILCVLVIFY